MAIMHKLTEDELEQAAGGYIFDNNDKECDWQVIDDETGDVIRRGLRRWEAEEFANTHGISAKRLSWNELKTLRETGSVEPSYYSYEEW